MDFDKAKGALSGSHVKKMVAGGLAAVFLAAAGFGSFYSVSQSDRANVRRFGNPVYSQPVGAGLHMKAPFIDEVDRVQVSLTTLHIPEFKVNTVDNQQITLKLNFNFTVPSTDVNHLLYEVGKAGSGDIHESIIPVVQDRAGRIFAQQNTTSISLNREQIQAQVTTEVFKAVKDLFGIEPHSLQFAEIGYSQAFVESNENAVKAKNEAVAEENKVAVEQARAQQKVIEAKANADAAIETARGESQSVLLNAQASKTKRELEGAGQAALLKAEIGAFNGDTKEYVEYLNAKAKNLWNGTPPTVMGGGNGSSPTVVVPVPAPAPAPK